LGLGFIPAPEKKLQDFSTHYAETLQSLETKINKNRQQNRNFVQFLTGDQSTTPKRAWKAGAQSRCRYDLGFADGGRIPLTRR
jgi:hypothetical protein